MNIYIYIAISHLFLKRDFDKSRPFQDDIIARWAMAAAMAAAAALGKRNLFFEYLTLKNDIMNLENDACLARGEIG